MFKIVLSLIFLVKLSEAQDTVQCSATGTGSYSYGYYGGSYSYDVPYTCNSPYYCCEDYYCCVAVTSLWYFWTGLVIGVIIFLSVLIVVIKACCCDGNKTAPAARIIHQPAPQVVFSTQPPAYEQQGAQQPAYPVGQQPFIYQPPMTATYVV